MAYVYRYNSTTTTCKETGNAVAVLPSDAPRGAHGDCADGLSVGLYRLHLTGPTYDLVRLRNTDLQYVGDAGKVRLSHSSCASQGGRARRREARASPTNGLADNRPNTVTISIRHGPPDLSCLRMYLTLVMLCNQILFRGELASRSGSCRLRPYGTYYEDGCHTRKSKQSQGAQERAKSAEL